MQIELAFKPEELRRDINVHAAATYHIFLVDDIPTLCETGGISGALNDKTTRFIGVVTKEELPLSITDIFLHPAVEHFALPSVLSMSLTIHHPFKIFRLPGDYADEGILYTRDRTYVIGPIAEPFRLNHPEFEYVGRVRISNLPISHFDIPAWNPPETNPHVNAS